MATPPLSQWLGSRYQIVLNEPSGERVVGTLLELVPEHHLTLGEVTIQSTGQKSERLHISASKVKDIIRVHTIETESKPKTKVALQSKGPTTASHQTAFQDPAIVSMSRKPTVQTALPHKAPSRNETLQTPIVTNPADKLTYSSPDETDTAGTASRNIDLPHISQLAIETASQPAALADTTEDDALDLTPTATRAQPRSARQERRRRRGRKNQNSRQPDEGLPSSSARPTNRSQGPGWRQTPILESTKSFQPFASLRKNRRKNHTDPSADSGWASEDVNDVQEAGDFDFEGGLAKFDKRTLFNEMREQDLVDEADRLVSHNRLPRPKPGTAGGKNFHYTENVLDTPSPAPKITMETPADYWRSEADDDDPVRQSGENASGREGSGRASLLRGESRISTAGRSQSRKASASVSVTGPSRMTSGPPTTSPVPPGLYTHPTNRRIDIITHLQMLVVENVASSELGLTEDLIAENAGRGICEVAMRTLEDPAIQLRATAASSSATHTIVVVAGNNKSGARAIAAARHIRNRNINILVCVVGIERERELLDEIRKQVRLFRNFGGTVCTKSMLFEHLSQSNNSSLNSSPQASVSLIIDALLGLTVSFEELRKSDQATTYELMEWANRNEAFVMAIDIPSGIEPSSGKVNVIDGAKLYVQPRYVVALGAPKSGLLKALGAMDEAGDVIGGDDWRIYLADIGIGAMAWRKAAKLRRGPDFDEGWVLELQYRPRRNGN
ncbi:YjeF N-terminal domain-like protein [Xylaria sp. CBS 124048]|nr:YjeF N-terminal domain-like protein [Xylaria sp. CBS 124048]